MFRHCWAYFHHPFMSPTTFPSQCLSLPHSCSHDFFLPSTMTHCPLLAPLLHQVGLSHRYSLIISLSLHAFPGYLLSFSYLPTRTDHCAVSQVNRMCSSLTDQVRSIAKVTTAVARGDLTQKIEISVEGEMSTLKGGCFLTCSYIETDRFSPQAP